ncbi:MAG: ATP-NAD kinase family protein [Thermoplasmatota archaeon]
MNQLQIGLVVNPIAGLGGPAGRKGSDADGQALLEETGVSTSLRRARAFVAAVGEDVSWTAPPGVLGAAAIDAVDPSDVAVVLEEETFALGHTKAEDTRRAARELAACHLDLIVFVGGDGTATDVAAAVGDDVPCLGVPGGVKITSPVFAHDVQEAAWLVGALDAGFPTTVRDVTDLDEEAYRAGRLETRLTGALRVPLSPAVQGSKVATTHDVPLDGLVDQVLEDWDRDAVWLVGAGSVCRAVKRQFWGEPTLLGVDAIDGDRIVANDLDAAGVRRVVAEAQAAGRPMRLLLSIIGGQGMLLGRGTQVLPPDALAAIGWDNITVAAPPEKLIGLRGLGVDSGDRVFDEAAPKYLRVTSGWHETRMVKVRRGVGDL